MVPLIGLLICNCFITPVTHLLRPFKGAGYNSTSDWAHFFSGTYINGLRSSN